MIKNGEDFTFETVLSTERNLDLLKKAKANGYFIRGIYVLTANPDINVARINARVALGGHGVPEEKVRKRYDKALSLIPQIVEVCDILHVYDNTTEPFRIFKKRKDVFFHWENSFWRQGYAADRHLQRSAGYFRYAAVRRGLLRLHVRQKPE